MRVQVGWWHKRSLYYANLSNHYHGKNDGKYQQRAKTNKLRRTMLVPIAATTAGELQQSREIAYRTRTMAGRRLISANIPERSVSEKPT